MGPDPSVNLYGSAAQAIRVPLFILDDLALNQRAFQEVVTEPGHETVLALDRYQPGAQGRLFQIFKRLRPEYPGTGVGLVMAHGVERMGGKVGA